MSMDEMTGDTTEWVITPMEPTFPKAELVDIMLDCKQPGRVVRYKWSQRAEHPPMCLPGKGNLVIRSVELKNVGAKGKLVVEISDETGVLGTWKHTLFAGSTANVMGSPVTFDMPDAVKTVTFRIGHVEE